MPRTKVTIVSNNGHNLTSMEDKFINLYIELGNISQAVVKAGYKSKISTYLT